MFDAATCADFWFAFSVTFRHVRICVFYFEIYKQGVQAAHSVLHQRRHWMMLVISRLITVTYLPNSWWNNVAVGSPFSFFKAVASNFRPFSVACPTHFRCFSDSLSIRFRHMSDSISIRFRCMSVSFPITIHATSTLTNYRLDYVGQCLKFPCYVNRGLWDNLSLPRTTPDKHVELSSVCVCVCACVCVAQSSAEVMAVFKGCHQTSPKVLLKWWLSSQMGVVGNGGHGRCLYLGIGRKCVRLQGFSDDAGAVIRGYLNLHPLLFALLNGSGPRNLREWRLCADSLYEAFNFWQIPGLRNGGNGYCGQWIVRTVLVALMRWKGIAALELGVDDKVADLCGPDESGTLAVLARITKCKDAQGCLRALMYKGPPELLAMWACLRREEVTGKKRQAQRKRAQDLGDVRGWFFCLQETQIPNVEYFHQTKFRSLFFVEIRQQSESAKDQHEKCVGVSCLSKQ